MLTKLEFAFLQACEEAVVRQQELVPLLAQQLGVQAQEVFYRWAMPPRCEQSGAILDTDWTYYFHGLECDLKNSQDGRFLRLDFGPTGRFDTFTGFGILQFVMTTKSPWREFPALRMFLAEGSPPYNELSGSHANMAVLARRLTQLQLVEVADPKLYALVRRHTQIQPDGSHVVSLPPEINTLTNTTFWDTHVCKNWVLSDLGQQIIKSRVPSPS